MPGHGDGTVPQGDGWGWGALMAVRNLPPASLILVR